MQDFIDWLQIMIGNGWTLTRGQWVEVPGSSGTFFASVHATGGIAPDVDDRKARYRVILLGPRNGRQHVVTVEQKINALALAALGETSPCGAASVRAIGEPVGPGYTEEDRAWYSLDFEVLS